MRLPGGSGSLESASQTQTQNQPHLGPVGWAPVDVVDLVADDFSCPLWNPLWRASGTFLGENGVLWNLLILRGGCRGQMQRLC